MIGPLMETGVSNDTGTKGGVGSWLSDSGVKLGPWVRRELIRLCHRPRGSEEAWVYQDPWVK